MQTSREIDDDVDDGPEDIIAKVKTRVAKQRGDAPLTPEQQAEYAEIRRRNALQRERGFALVSELRQWVTRVTLVLAGTFVAIFIGEGWPGVMAAEQHGLVKLAFLFIVWSSVSVMYRIAFEG